MIGGDNLDEINKLCLTLHGVRTTKWGVKNAEQGREKQRMNKEEGGRVELRVGLAYGHWLTGYIVFLGQGEHLQRTKSDLSFGLLTWHRRQEQLHLGPRNLFKLHWPFLCSQSQPETTSIPLSRLQGFLSLPKPGVESLKNWEITTPLSKFLSQIILRQWQTGVPPLREGIHLKHRPELPHEIEFSLPTVCVTFPVSLLTLSSVS